MKNNLLFLLVLIALFVTAMGALFYQYQYGDLNQQEQKSEVIIIDENETAPESSPAGELMPGVDAALEAQPTISQDDDLETLLQELDSTVILEEEFDDL